MVKLLSCGHWQKSMKAAAFVRKLARAPVTWVLSFHAWSSILKKMAELRKSILSSRIVIHSSKKPLTPALMFDFWHSLLPQATGQLAISRKRLKRCEDRQSIFSAKFSSASPLSDLKDLIIPCTKLEWHTVNSHAVWLTQQKQTRFFGLLLRAMLPRLTLWKQTCKFSLWSTIAIMQTLPNT